MTTPRTKKLGNINLDITEQLHQALLDLSFKSGRTVSAEVRRALYQYVKRHGFDIKPEPAVALGRPKKKKT